MEIIRGYRIRIYPNKKQEQKLLQICGAVRFVWNYYLNKRKKEYLERRTVLSYYDCAKDLTSLKKQPEYKWLNEVKVDSLQQSLRDLDKAYNSFFNKRTALPKFKSKKTSQPSFRLPHHWRVVGNRIFLAKDLSVKFRGSKLPGHANLKSIVIWRDRRNKWYGSIISHETISPEPKTGDPIGIDMGLYDLATTSNGEKYPNFRPKKRLQKEMKALQQNLSRKRSGSNGRAKAKQSLAVLHKKIANQRLNYLHQTSHRITSKNHALIVCEDLAVMNMMKNHKLAESIEDSGWAEFMQQLEYKQVWRGGTFTKVDRFFPSSKTCSSCGFVVDRLPLSVRQWSCPSCKAEHDRDVNAARMILAQGLSNNPEWRVQRVS